MLYNINHAYSKHARERGKPGTEANIQGHRDTCSDEKINAVLVSVYNYSLFKGTPLPNSSGGYTVLDV